MFNLPPPRHTSTLLGSRRRWLPARAFLRRLPLGLDVSLDGLWFCDGGTLELSGVFGGWPSLASRSSTCFNNRAITSACAKMTSISCSRLSE